MTNETPDDSDLSETDCESDTETIIELEEEAGNSETEENGRRVPVNPSSGDLQPADFHRQDWLLVAEANVKVTWSYYTFTNFLEHRAEYARESVPSIIAEADALSVDIRTQTDYWWDGTEPVEPQDIRSDHEPDGIQSIFTVRFDHDWHLSPFDPSPECHPDSLF